MAQLDELLKRAEKGDLLEKDIELIKGMAECIAVLSQAVDEKATSVKKLLRLVFGVKTEKKEQVLGNNTNEEKSAKTDPESGDAQKKKQGHNNGKNSAAKYTGADQVTVEHSELKPGSFCSKCKDGKLYQTGYPGVKIRVAGAAPLQATVYKLEKLRCNLCGKIFTASLPKEVSNKKYDSTAASMIALLKYGSGLPFNRLQGLQASLGVPLPSSTQWDVVNKSSRIVRPVYIKLIEMAAQGEIFHNDDTTIKIQNLIKENRCDSPARKGMFTTGIVSIKDDQKIILFLSGRKHAGENLDGVLAKREPSLPTPLQMCDALSRNTSGDFSTILAYCLVHARRHFVDAAMNFPEECEFVINTLAEVYRFDAETKEEKMFPKQRLQYHQKNSAKLLSNLKVWLNEQFDQKKVESNSSLGQAITYMLKHWQKLTTFLRVSGAPLDNNVCERALKKVILHRKNSLFYKSENGSSIGDMFMSIIYTCEQAGVNPFNYLNALQDNADLAKTTPSKWMPWNYFSNFTD